MDHNLRDFGCKYRLIPHDLTILHESGVRKVEKCKLCGKVLRWNKMYKSRVNNQEYVKAHIRNLAQEFGRTHGVYNRVYKPSKAVIKIV